MVMEHIQPIEIFYSYAYKDEKLRTELDKHLFNLKRQGFITGWYDRDISAGTEWEREIDVHLNTAKIILLLISPDFMASDYCYSIEMKRALGQHEAGNAHVIPIILKSVDWQGTPLQKLQALPRNGKAVTSQRNRSEVFFEIAKDIREIIRMLKPTAFDNSSSSVMPNLEALSFPISDLLPQSSGYEKQSRENAFGSIPYEKTLDIAIEELDETTQQIWYMPYQRNRFFTGRETFFAAIRNRLMNNVVLPCSLAINGLGGIGKTQLVVEYAYRYRSEYTAVLWFNADSQESLIDSYVSLANELDLPEKGAQNRNATLRIVHRWLRENPHCLIVLDNVEDPAAIYEFLLQMGESHIILTTRAQAIGVVAQVLELGGMDIEESMLLLLRRAQIAPAHALLASIPDTSLHLARNIAFVMGGLPLALNQAASYIEETGCGLRGYLRLIEAQLAKMLKVNDRALLGDHHTSVTATWTLSFEKIKQNNAAAAELLYLCAFLSPEKIYEEFILESAPALGVVLQTVATDPIELHRAIAELRKYSLLRTDPDSGALSIHRLVQTVIQDTMDEEIRRLWAERTIKAVNQAFPLVEVARWHETWSKCQRYYPQADASIELIQQWQFTGHEVSQLLNKIGKYLEERTQFRSAEHLYHRALELDRKFYGNLHSRTVKDLSNIAMLYERQGKYESAEKKYREALLIYDKIDPKHYDLAIFRNYITLLHKMKRGRDAEEWKRRVKDLYPKQARQIGRRVPIGDDNERIIYNGEWQTRIHEGDFNSSAHFTNSEGSSFLYTFEGWGIEIISDTSSIRGEIEILIDDVKEETVDTQLTANKLSQTIVFSKTDLPQGMHTLKVILRHGEFILNALAFFFYEKEDIFPLPI